MNSRLVRFLSWVVAAALLNAAGGIALAVHLRAHAGCCGGAAGQEGCGGEKTHDESSCSTCLFLKGAAGKFIHETDAVGAGETWPAEWAAAVERAEASAIHDGPQVTRGPPLSA